MFVIAGVSGHTGSIVAQKLLERQKPVRVFVRDAKKGEPWKKQGAEVAIGSLSDSKALGTALRGATGFFVLLPPNFAAKNVFEYQRQMADAITKAVSESKVPHVVMLSSVGADLDADNGPIRGLNYLESALRKSGTRLTAIRAGSFQENLEHAVDTAKSQGVFYNFQPTLDHPMPIVATKDIGMLAAQVLVEGSKKSEVIDIHGPAYTQRQVVEKLQSVTGKQLKIVDVPETQWIPAMVQGGFPQSFAESAAEMYMAFGKGMISPKGDRAVQGKTTLDETLKHMNNRH